MSEAFRKLLSVFTFLQDLSVSHFIQRPIVFATDKTINYTKPSICNSFPNFKEKPMMFENHTAHSHISTLCGGALKPYTEAVEHVSADITQVMYSWWHI